MHHEGEDRKRRKEREQETEQSAVARYPVPEAPVKANAVQSAPLIEFSTEAREDPNEGLVFGETPERCTCPHCERSVVTFIDYEASWVTWLLAIVVWFSLGWMAFWVLPLLWPAFKDVVHHCPRCLNVVARKSRIALPTFRTEVCSFKIGNCAVVLARKYVIIFLGLTAAIVGVYLCRSFVHLNATSPEAQKGPPSMLTWEDFLFDCGPKSSLRSRASSSTSFDEKYRRRTFKWQGEVRVIKEGFEVFFLKTKSVIMVRMYPSRFPRRENLPDVALLFSEAQNKEIAELEPNDWVEFEATMTLHGFRGDPELMTLWHVKKVERPNPLSSSPGHASGAISATEHEHQPQHENAPAMQAQDQPRHESAPAEQAKQDAAAQEAKQEEAAAPEAKQEAAAPEVAANATT